MLQIERYLSLQTKNNIKKAKILTPQLQNVHTFRILIKDFPADRNSILVKNLNTSLFYTGRVAAMHDMKYQTTSNPQMIP